MMRKITILSILMTICQGMMAAIGNWKAYMAYSEVQEIEQAGKLIFVQASNNLYVYNQNDQSIQTFSKVDYLSDCDIQHIAYNNSTTRLLILYSNGNIDFMDIDDYQVTNLSDYYAASVIGDKTVNSIYMYGNDAYMNNGFGIVRINAKDMEIRETYQLGFNVEWCEIENGFIYAYSKQQGKYQASLNTNLLDKNNWDRVGDYVENIPDDKDELRQLVETLSPGGPKYNHFWYMKFAHDRLYTCGGAFMSGIVDARRPGCVQVLETGGAVSQNTNYEEWDIYQDELNNITGYEYMNINCVEPDISDPGHVFASGKSGLYEFRNGKMTTYYNQDNSILEGAVDGTDILGNDYVLVHSLYSDTDGSLWLLNSQTQHNSIIRLKDGQFVSHHKPSLMVENYSLPGMVGLKKDSQGLLWFVNNNSNGTAIACYDIERDSVWVMKRPFYNQDATNLSIYYIRCIEEDIEGNMWIGTDQGPFYLSRRDLENNNQTLNQVKVPRNDGTNYADYLLGGTNITCMAIDEGNQKWFGTSGNGVYLIGSDNISQIQHFTIDNSPLLSNSVESIAINDQTGEVFFGTDKGLCSYMGNATTANEEMSKETVWAYPNPVTPDYTGLITITGLSYNADIKIVSSNGTLVNQGKSTGGTYTWDGRDTKGRRVASGVYMAEIATQEGKKGAVCKIAIVN